MPRAAGKWRSTRSTSGGLPPKQGKDEDGAPYTVVGGPTPAQQQLFHAMEEHCDPRQDYMHWEEKCALITSEFGMELPRGKAGSLLSNPPTRAPTWPKWGEDYYKLVLTKEDYCLAHQWIRWTAGMTASVSQAGSLPKS